MILPRAAAGVCVAATIALVARRAGSLSTSGTVAATLVGGVSMAVSWPFGALLVLYFLSSTLLSRVGAAEKVRRTGSVVQKGGARDATQVLANGGAFTALLLGALVAPRLAPTLEIVALGALAASAADTWATEIGTLVGRTPRSLLTLRAVPTGTSGGVSVPGSLATIAGALFVALVARALSAGDAVAAVSLGGVAGAFADSLLGAVAQERRWCASCERFTERRVHDCGAPTRHAGGLEWMDNDVVNLLATLVGAAVTAALVIV